MKQTSLILLLIAGVVMATKSCSPAPSSTSAPVTIFEPSDSINFDMHSAENSLDIGGRYTGSLFAMGQEEVKTTLVIHQADYTYQLTAEYSGTTGGEEREEGAYILQGNFLTLSSEQGVIRHFRVGEAALREVDVDKHPTGGELHKQ